MSVLVLDASVAAKWFLPAGETLGEEALHLLRRYSSGQLRFLVPDLFWAELGNILWKAARQGRLSPAAAKTALTRMREPNLPTVSSAELLPAALAIATTFDRTVYDSLYVALAVASKAQFVTADVRLASALAAHLPVKWLGSL
ncbi:MAG: type II toxin-antitoxin system VapC family toxin [Acidobacteria bacterium]|nr:type II toxin-antitoxin system VapC family toxin [Acidobacteriota bacterium]